jgi:hypothetical protein
MKEFTEYFLDLLRADGIRLSTYVELEVPDVGSYYLSGSDQITQEFGRVLTGKILRWTPSVASVPWLNSALHDASFSLEIANNPSGTDWKTFVEEIAGVDVHTIKVKVWIQIKNRAPELYQGWVERIESYDYESITLNCSLGLSHVDSLFGNLINPTSTGLPTCEDNQGKMMPWIYGRINNCPLILITKATEADLQVDITEDDTLIHLHNVKYNGGVYYTPGTLFIGGELIAYYGINSTASGLQLTGVQRGFYHTIKSRHYAGELAIQWQAVTGWANVLHNYLVADHEVLDIANVRVGDKLAPASDYTKYLQIWRGEPAGWKSVVQFSRNPIYPDEAQNTVTRKIYFRYGSGATDINNVLEAEEGDGPLGEGRDFAFIPGTGTARLRVNADTEWDKAKYSLGKIKSAKLVLKTRVSISDVDDLKPEVDVTASTARVKMSNGAIPDWLELDTCKATGEAQYGHDLPRSAQGITGIAEKPSDAENWRDEHLACDWPGWAWIRIYHMEDPDKGNRLGYCALTMNFPEWKIKNTIEVFMELKYKIYQPRGAYQAPTMGVLITTEEDGEQHLAYLPRSSTGQYIWSAYLTEHLSKRIKSITVFIEGGTLNYQQNYDILYAFLRYRYQPTDYGDTKIQEYDIDLSEWGSLDNLLLEVDHTSTGTGTKELRIYDAHIEVEYWPYKPTSTPKVTADVKGLYGQSNLTGENEHPENVLRNLIGRGIGGRTQLGIWIDQDSFETYTTGENYCDLRLDQQESIIALLGRIAYENRRWLLFYSSKFYCIRRPDTLGTPDWIIGEDEIIEDTYQVKPQSVFDLITELEYKMHLNHAERRWETSGILEVATPSTVGKKKQSLSLYSRSTVEDTTVQQHYLDMFGASKNFHHFQLVPEGMKLEPGDVLQVTYPRLNIEDTKLLVLTVEVPLPDLTQGTGLNIGIIGVEY